LPRINFERDSLQCWVEGARSSWFLPMMCFRKRIKMHYHISGAERCRFTATFHPRHSVEDLIEYGLKWLEAMTVRTDHSWFYAQRPNQNGFIRIDNMPTRVTLEQFREEFDSRVFVCDQAQRQPPALVARVYHITDQQSWNAFPYPVNFETTVEELLKFGATRVGIQAPILYSWDWQTGRRARVRDRKEKLYRIVSNNAHFWGRGPVG
jgi:hypothetical protein